MFNVSKTRKYLSCMIIIHHVCVCLYTFSYITRPHMDDDQGSSKQLILFESFIEEWKAIASQQGINWVPLEHEPTHTKISI